MPFGLTTQFLRQPTPGYIDFGNGIRVPIPVVTQPVVTQPAPTTATITFPTGQTVTVPIPAAPKPVTQPVVTQPAPTTATIELPNGQTVTVPVPAPVATTTITFPTGQTVTVPIPAAPKPVVTQPAPTTPTTITFPTGQTVTVPAPALVYRTTPWWFTDTEYTLNSDPTIQKETQDKLVKYQRELKRDEHRVGIHTHKGEQFAGTILQDNTTYSKSQFIREFSPDQEINDDEVIELNRRIALANKSLASEAVDLNKKVIETSNTAQGQAKIDEITKQANEANKQLLEVAKTVPQGPTTEAPKTSFVDVAEAQYAPPDVGGFYIDTRKLLLFLAVGTVGYYALKNRK